MGLRIADEFNDRNCCFLSPVQTIKAMIINAALSYLGIKL